MCLLIAATNGFTSSPPALISSSRAKTATQSQLVVQLADNSNDTEDSNNASNKEHVVIIGAGWGGLSAAHSLSKNDNIRVTVVDASPRVGGLVRDGFTSITGKRPAEAGQHGFWDNYHNIFNLLQNEISSINIDDVLTGYAEQGQYSPAGLEAVWPVYRNQSPVLPTGLAQALYTKFTKLSPLDRASAAPLVLAFSEFDDSPEAWAKYDNVSFRDLCTKLGVSRKCYDEAFEPMILTGLFAPGAECSAAAALGMAYFFVLKSQNSFDVRWCRGNVGDTIFDKWVQEMESRGVIFQTSTRVTGFETNGDKITSIQCKSGEEEKILKADTVVFAVGAAALNGIVRNSPELAQHAEFRRFANLRGTGVLATRLYLDRTIDTPYSANACWGFDRGVGMTFFDITKLQDNVDAPGSVIEVDYYHAATLLVMSDDDIVSKAKNDLDVMLGEISTAAEVVDAAVVRLPSAVNWYYPGSYADMPDMKSEVFSNTFFVGDIVRSRHGSWSQEKAYVTGMEAANSILGRPVDTDVIPLSKDEPHVAFGRSLVSVGKTVLGRGDPSRAPSLVDFLW